MKRREPDKIKDWEPDIVTIDPEEIPEKKLSKFRIFLWKAFEKPWHWLNGKKLIIGSTMLAVGLVIPGSWGLALKGFGTALTTVGGLHKIGKYSKYGAKGEFNKKDFLQLINDLIATVINLFKIIKAMWSKIKQLKNGG